MRSFQRLSRWCCVVIISLFSTAVTAQTNASPPIILEITGASKTAAGSSTKQYDIGALEQMTTIDVITETPWTEGTNTFHGVLMRNLLDDANFQGPSVTAVALNDYTVEIPIADFINNDVILAFKKNGEYLTVRGKGPLWIISPWSDVKLLQSQVYYSRSIWQVRKIEVNPN